jgi:PhnB protein
MAKPDPIPTGHHTVTPYLIIKGALNAIDFYKRAFGASLAMPPLESADGRVRHAEIRIGTSVVMLADEFPEERILGPQAIGGSPVSLHLYVDGADKVVNVALAAGATLLRPVEDQFYGDRMGSVTDPFGYVWHVATHIEDVSPDDQRSGANAARQS